jgi:hypothetical protein
MPPYDQVFHKWKANQLHSGSKTGPVVKNQKQAVAIFLSEKRKAAQGKSEYKPAMREEKPSRAKRYSAKGDGLQRKRKMYS